MLDYYSIMKAFLSIFVIMDPFGGITILMSLTKKQSVFERRNTIKKAVSIAAFILLLFIFFGGKILEFFGISLNSFRIAGGIILLIMGIEYVLDLRITRESLLGYSIAAVPLATPLITGPGVITSAIIIVIHYGKFIALIAAGLSLLMTFIIFYYSNIIYKFLGKQGNEILSRLMGLVLTAIAVEFIVQGIKGMFFA
ncbi:MAG: MarC family protein [Candidatus Woesearchaeota archaeon]